MENPPLCPVWAQEHCRISSPRFLAECHKKRLNQDGFVLLYDTIEELKRGLKS